MKKILVLLLAILMVFAIVSCKDEPEQADEPQATEGQGKDNLLSQGAKSGAKAIDHKGFKIVGKYSVAETELVVEVGGKDGIGSYLAGVSGFLGIDVAGVLHVPILAVHKLLEVLATHSS